MMTKHDLDLLNRCHDIAVKEMASASASIADVVASGYWPSHEQMENYRIAKKKVDATRKDLEYSITLELRELLES